MGKHTCACGRQSPNRRPFLLCLAAILAIVPSAVVAPAVVAARMSSEEFLMAAPPATLADYLDALTDLSSGPRQEEPGTVAFTVKRCLYVPEKGFEEFADATGLSAEVRTLIRPKTGWCYVVVELSVLNRHFQESFAVKNALDFRLEDGGENFPGWDIFKPAQRALSGSLPAIMDMEAAPGQEVRGYALFRLPEGTKNLWYAGYSKVGGTLEKKYTSASRRGIGDLPGEEPVQPHRSGYKVVIGSFIVRANALEWAERARANGLCAWVQEAYEPEGMYVVLTKLTNDYRQACDHLYIAKERGYADAYVIGRAAPQR